MLNKPLLTLSALVAQLMFFSWCQAQQKTVVARITITGNHKTKDEIITRELSFKTGDTLYKDELDAVLERSKSNLVNTLLFNYVEMQTVPVDSIFTDVFIHIKERFYLWPIPVFQFADPNFNTWWLKKDFSRTNYGLVILKKNFRGKNEDLGAKVQLGYSKEFAATYRRPYLNKKQNYGGGVWVSYVQNNEITVGTENNKRLFYTGETGNSRDELSIRSNLSYRAKLYSIHNLEFRFNRVRVLDTIAEMSALYLSENAKINTYPSLWYTFRHDRRDNKGYPLKGRFTQIDLIKHGIGGIGRFAPDVFHVIATHNEFFQVSPRFFFAAQFKGKYTPSKSLPYYYQEGLGYTNFVRGYEYYVIDGQSFGLFKSNIKFCLYGPKIHDLKMLENTNFSKFHYAFYLNLFIDAGYVSDNRYYNLNPLANNMLYGSGIGIDFVSFYDKVIRFEYSLNKELEKGFFIHFIKPI